MKFDWAIVLPLLALVSGCAPYKYHPAPVSPPALAANLEARSLDDVGLRAWMKQAADYQASAWPMATWDLNALTLAAYYFNADMDVARANAAVADAAITTAGMKPNLTVGASGGYETSLESPYLFGLDFSLPIETAGKRGYRIAEATHLSEASQLQLAETAWTVRSRVRMALVDLLFAEKEAAALREQESLQSKYADLLEARFRAGEIPLPEVTAARIVPVIEILDIDVNPADDAIAAEQIVTQRCTHRELGPPGCAARKIVSVDRASIEGHRIAYIGIQQLVVIGGVAHFCDKSMRPGAYPWRVAVALRLPRFSLVQPCAVVGPGAECGDGEA